MTGMGLAVVVAYGFKGASGREGISIACTGLMVAAAAALTGALLGFLFGIPRTLSGNDGQGRLPHVQGEHVVASEYVDNTNLEQLSDWLTKILVGVGLTQISKIKEGMGDLAGFLAPQLDHSAPFALGIVVFFAVCGFLRAYLWTRLSLKSELRESNRLWELEEKVQELQPEAEVAIALAYAMAIMSHKHDDDPAAGKPREKAVQYLERARKRVPGSREVGILLGRVLRRQKQLDRAIQVLTEVIGARAAAGQGSDPDTAALLYNRACYHNLAARSAIGAEQEQLRKRARDDLRRALELSPEERAGAAKDDDLKELQDVWQ